MRKLLILFAMLISLFSTILNGAEKDAKGCKDHPLIARVPGYYIASCNQIPAGANLDIIKGDKNETINFEGKSIAYLYMPKQDLKTKTSAVDIRNHFDNSIKKLNGSLMGVTSGQKWPVYIFAKEGKEYWVVLMIDEGKYFTGSYAFRVIEKNK